MERSIKDELLLKEEKVGEIEIFITDFFGEASQVDEKKIVHGGQVEIHYSKKGQVQDIVVKNGENKRLIDSLIEGALDAIYSDHGVKVAKEYVFFNQDVTAATRYLDEFQIIPLPDGAPKPEEVTGKHPAIIEFSYLASSNAHIDIYRKENRMIVLFDLINLLVFGGINWRSKYLKKHWVYLPVDEREPHFPSEVAFLQEGYVFHDASSVKDDLGFTVNNQWPDVSREESKTYYNKPGISVWSDFTLPDSFEYYLGKFSELSKSDSRAFSRALHWFKKSSDVYTISHSLSYSALVYALEGLLEKPVNTGKCPTCNRDNFDKSVSNRFREFLDKHSIGLPSDQINEIYRIRSSIAHGGGLMPRDEEMPGFRFNVNNNSKDAVFRKLQHVCQLVLLSWLSSPDRISA